MHSTMSIGFMIWIVTTQIVNFAFFLSITRLAYGWKRTIASYLVYFAALAVIFPLSPLAHGGSHGTSGTLSVTFIGFYALWAGLTVAMSRIERGRSFFAALLCGSHQLIAFAISLLILHHIPSEILGPALASATMALMGWFLIALPIPRVLSLPGRSGWTQMNIMAISIFLLLYTAGIWPIYVAGESLPHVILFLIAAVVAFVFFQMALAFSEKSHKASSLAAVEDNLRLMSDQLDSRRETIASARQICKDRRARCKALADILHQGQIKEALAYLAQIDAESRNLMTEQVDWCENETVNAVLSGYASRAEAAGLIFSAMASVNEHRDLPELIMVEMLSSLLDVAIRTARAGGEVSCLIRQRADSLGITVTSTVPPEFKLSAARLPLDAADPRLSSALSLARKRKSECRYRLENGLLTCNVILTV